MKTLETVYGAKGVSRKPLAGYGARIGVACVVALAWATIALGGTAGATPLDDYVAAPDPAFQYEKIGEKVKGTHTTYAFYMVSQNWLDKSQVDRTLWEHVVLVTVPKDLKYNGAMMFIGGGGNNGDLKKTSPDNEEMEQIAIMTKAIVAQVKQIPNQPLHFVGDTEPKYKQDGRREDELISFGWDKFLTSGDPLWLARLPMTKAVVRAMDVVQKEFPKVDGFFVAGGSKRGWTTWTVAAVDKRVIGIAPAVIDVLNLEASLQSHYDAYGFWAPAVGDYVETKVVDRIHTPEFRELMKVVDPYSYRDRLTMPKYILNGSGDQFFPPHSWQFYFKDLPDEKYLCYVPNTDHGLNANAYFYLASFFSSLLTDTPRPKFTWDKEADGTLRVKCETKPSEVTLWQAYNPEARDFRLETFGKKYESSPLAESEPGVYVASVKPEEKGWKAFFIEMKFPNPSSQIPFVFTTGISVAPDTFPGKK